MGLEYEIWNWWMSVVKPYFHELCTNPEQEQKFNDFVASFIDQLLIKPKKLAGDTTKVYNEVKGNRYNFEYAREMVAWCRENVTRESMLNYFEREILNNSAVLVSQVLGKDMPDVYSLENCENSEALGIVGKTKDGLKPTGKFYSRTVPSERDIKLLGLN